MMLSIRRATLADVPILAELVLVVHELHVQQEPQRYKAMRANDPAVRAFFTDLLSKESAHVFLALDGDQPIGYVLALLREVPENPFVHSGRALHIDQMSVNTAYQGQGVGTRLMETVLELAQTLGAERVSLGVAVFNTRAIRFYERLGFTIYHHRMSRKTD